MQDYKIITGNTTSLEKQVNDAISHGWQPQGGLCAHPIKEIGRPVTFYQTMIKVVNENG